MIETDQMSISLFGGNELFTCRCVIRRSQPGGDIPGRLGERRLVTAFEARLQFAPV